MFTIRIKDLQAAAIVGVYDWEQEKKQPVLLNIAFDIRNNKATESDALADTVDYALIERRILVHLERSRYQLIEKLAAEVAGLVLTLDDRIYNVTVEVDKPGALERARSVSVTVKKER